MFQRILLTLALIVGILLVLFHDDVIESIRKTTSEKDIRTKIATLVHYSGKVRYKMPKTLKYYNVTDGLDLKDQDTLTTDADSTAQIVFDSGFELEVQPNSMIIIEKPTTSETGAIQITFLRGDYKVIKQGGSGQVVVAKDKKFQDLAGRPPLEPLNIKIKIDETPTIEKSEELEELKPIAVIPTPTPKEVKRKQKESLPDEYIASVVNNQKPFFNRCYAQHLRLNPESRGQIHLAFTILSSGKVTNVSLINSTMNDPQLDRCTMSVIERCRFRTYEGDPIIVNYPINFE